MTIHDDLYTALRLLAILVYGPGPVKRDKHGYANSRRVLDADREARDLLTRYGYDRDDA